MASPVLYGCGKRNNGGGNENCIVIYQQSGCAITSEESGSVGDKQSLKDRIGVDLGRRVPLEDGIEWAAKNQVCYIDAQTDIEPNALETFDKTRCSNVKSACEKHNIHLGLHTLSGVNVAEFSPFCRDAVDEYLKAYIDLAPRVGAQWIVVHGGYHFTACRERRIKAAVERLQRIGDYAEKKGVLLLLENLNSVSYTHLTLPTICSV